MAGSEILLNQGAEAVGSNPVSLLHRIPIIQKVQKYHQSLDTK